MLSSAQVYAILRDHRAAAAVAARAGDERWRSES
jgi:hypothetical protein